MCFWKKASNRARTGDLFLTMEALYLLSYGSKKVAPKVGLEPTTIALTVRCSTTELLRNNNILPGNVLLSQGETPNYHRR